MGVEIHSDDQLQKRRSRMIRDLKKHRVDYSEITCDECEVRSRCLESYDIYNTDGDCLAIK